MQIMVMKTILSYSPPPPLLHRAVAACLAISIIINYIFRCLCRDLAACLLPKIVLARPGKAELKPQPRMEEGLDAVPRLGQ